MYTGSRYPSKHHQCEVGKAPYDRSVVDDSRHCSLTTDQDLQLRCPQPQNRNRLSWDTILEDAKKLDGYKQMYAERKKWKEMQVPTIAVYGH